MPDGVTSMMFNEQNGPPWHRKGKPVRGLATASDCIREAGLDWGVGKIPLRLDDTSGLPLPGRMATVRTDLQPNDHQRILGIVGEEYRPLQNWEAFGFFDTIVGQGAAIYETAGAIDNGKRIWLLAKLPTTIEPVKDDVVQPYLLLANSHDGSLMVHIKFTPIRVVCQNTLAMALVEKDGRRVAIRHDRALRRNLDDAAALLGLVTSTVQKTQSAWKRMAERGLAEAEALRYFQSVFGGQPSEGQDRRITGLKQAALENFESRSNRDLGIQGTLWAAYNAATWSVDWSRNSSKDRVDDLCLGEGAQMKERALQEAEKLLAGAQRPETRSGPRPPASDR